MCGGETYTSCYQMGVPTETGKHLLGIMFVTWFTHYFTIKNHYCVGSDKKVIVANSITIGSSFLNRDIFRYFFRLKIMRKRFINSIIKLYFFFTLLNLSFFNISIFHSLSFLTIQKPWHH